MKQPTSLSRWTGQLQEINRVEAAIDHDEVFRYAGYPAGYRPHPKIVELFDRWIEAASEVATPRAVFMVLPVVALEKRLLRLTTNDGDVEFRGAIGEFLGPAQYVAAFISTAGPGIGSLAAAASEQDDSLAAVIVNAVGAERAEAAEAEVLQQLRLLGEPSGFAATLPYSPGYCGMALTEQRPLFSLFGGSTSGVTLSEDCLMRPLKSVSGLIGLAPADQIEEYGSPCDRCELNSCAMRR